MKKLTILLLLSALATSATAAMTPARLSIVNDDLSGARAEALRRHVPIFVEIWAPW